MPVEVLGEVEHRAAALLSIRLSTWPFGLLVKVTLRGRPSAM
jgi:hypothetical protein